MAQKKSPSNFWPTTVIIGTVLCFIIALPDSWTPWVPTWAKPEAKLGLDLAGGTQLDFRISEEEIIKRKSEISAEIEVLKTEGKNQDTQLKQLELQSVEEQHAKIVEAIRTVLERRINSLGVSEATITPSYYGTEKHLLVECPGIIDVDRCIATVGKTIRLEFKEQYTGSGTDFADMTREKAEKTYLAVTRGTGSLQVAGQDLSDQLGIQYNDVQQMFIDQVPFGLEELKNRTTKDPVLKKEATIPTIIRDEQGQPTIKEIKGIYLAQVIKDKALTPKSLSNANDVYEHLAKTLTGAVHTMKSNIDSTQAPQEIQAEISTMETGTQKSITLSGSTPALMTLLGKTEGKEEMKASHLLIQYKGAERADETVVRTKEEAKTLADDMKKRMDAGEQFDVLAKEYSDGPSKNVAGDLGNIVRGQMVAPFEAAAFALKVNEISNVIETQFGFHIIRANSTPTTSPAKITYELLTLPQGTDATALLKEIEGGKITKQEYAFEARTLFFSLEPTGWRDTELNGQHFLSASATTDPQTNFPVVRIQFNQQGAKLFEELTRKNIGKRIGIFVGGSLVSAPNVNEPIAGGTAVITGSKNLKEATVLAQDLNTGAIPAPIFLSGQHTIEPTLGANALAESVKAAAIGLGALALFMFTIYRGLGFVVNAALILYVILLIAFTKLPLFLITRQHIVLTLAGIAGMILSMGMAVDANVLAFERVKEELKRGKTFQSALEIGFKKAWPSVRDGNTSTLITCAILFTIGTSIIRGFAVTLAMGIAISLFTAIVVSRWLCRKLANSPLVSRPEFFGIKKEEISTIAQR